MSQTEVQLIKDSAVVTADIADQAVTLDKLPHGTGSNDGKFLRANNGADPSFETVTSTTINNNADNRIITGSGTANTLNGESALTFDGTLLKLQVDSGEFRVEAANGVDAFSVDSDNGNTVIGGSGTLTIPDTIVHAGDTNTKIRFPAADTVSIETGGNERLRVDSSGRLLVGTTDTLSKLTVDTDLGVMRSSSDPTINLLLGTTSSITKLYRILIDDSDSDKLQIRDNDTARITMDGSGNVLVGTTSSRDLGGLSSQKLVIEDTSGSACVAIVNNQNSTGFASLRFSKSRGTSVGSSTVVQSGDTLGGIVFCGADGTDMASVGASILGLVDGTPGSNDMPGRLSFRTTADGATSATEHMRIHKTGQVSIAHPNYISDSHDYKLVVKPNINDSSKGGLGILIDGDTGTSGGASVDSISLKVKNTNTWNNATKQYGGYFEVGQQLLQHNVGVYSQVTGLYNNSRCYEAVLNKNLAAVTEGVSYYSNVVPTNSGGAVYHFFGQDNGSTKIYIEQDGDIKNSNNSYAGTSDLKLKENIVDANSQWDDIKGLRIRNFNFKDDPDKVKMLGVVAQEAETVSAGLIDTKNDVEVDDATGEGTITGTTKYVKYSILYMKAVKALQEAMTRIETLETEVAALKSA